MVRIEYQLALLVATLVQNTSVVVTKQIEPQPKQYFETCHELAKGDDMWTEVGDADGNDMMQYHQEERKFCYAVGRRHSTYFDGVRQCCSAISIAAASGQNRSELNLRKRIGNYGLLPEPSNNSEPTNSSVPTNSTEPTKDKDNQTAINPKNQTTLNQNQTKEDQKIVDGSSEAKDIKQVLEEDIIKRPYTTLLANYKDQESIKDQDALFMANITFQRSRQALSAAIDPEFPYILLDSDNFLRLFPQEFANLGFDYVNLPLKNGLSKTDSQQLMIFRANQSCDMLYGCFHEQRFTLSSSSVVGGAGSSGSQALNSRLDVTDLLIDSFSPNGKPQCTFSVVSCKYEGTCPTTVGKVLLRNFDTILDLHSNQIMLRESDSRWHHQGTKKAPGICKGKPLKKQKPDTLVDKALDWFLYLYYGALYLRKPSNIYYELVLHPHNWVIQAELALGLLAIVIPIAVLFFSSFFLFIEAVPLAAHYFGN